MQRILLAVVATVAFAVSAHAQQSQHPVMPSSRWVLNGHSTAALGTSVGDDFGSLDTQGGLGAGVEVGYRVTPRLLAYAGVDIAKQGISEVGLDGDFGLTHIEAGARLSFPITGSKLMPYVGGWVGRRSLTTTVDDFETGISSDLSLSGLGAGASGGVQFFVLMHKEIDLLYTLA